MVRSLAVVYFVKVNEPSSCTYEHPAVCPEINAFLHKTLVYREDSEAGEGKDPHWAE